MLSLLKNQIEKYSTTEEKFNYLREIIQIQTLKIIDQQGFSKNILITYEAAKKTA